MAKDGAMRQAVNQYVGAWRDMRTARPRQGGRPGSLRSGSNAGLQEVQKRVIDAAQAMVELRRAGPAPAVEVDNSAMLTEAADERQRIKRTRASAVMALSPSVGTASSLIV